MQELRTVKYARTTLYLRTLRKRNTYVLRLRYVNFFLAPTVCISKYTYSSICRIIIIIITNNIINKKKITSYMYIYQEIYTGITSMILHGASVVEMPFYYTLYIGIASQVSTIHGSTVILKSTHKTGPE